MKLIRILIRTLFYIPLGAIVYFAILIFTLLNPPSCCLDFTQTKLYRWNKVSPGNALSSDGSSYHMFSKKGASNNLIIYFSGGGMAWDARSAFSPMGITSLIRKNKFGYFFSNIPIYILALLHGMLDNKNKNNPFYNWNIVYLPYSTGDMHIGDNVMSYVQKGKIKKIHHKGKHNTAVCLNWIYNNFDCPDKIMVCGDSAGAFAAPYWINKITEHYNISKMFCLSDGAYLKSKSWPAIIDGIWKTRFEDTFGYKVSEDPLAEAIINSNRMSGRKIVMMHANTVYDKISALYQTYINDESRTGIDYINKWSQDMLRSVKRIASNTDNYIYYLTKYGYSKSGHSTPHTITRYPKFYRVKENDVLFTKWLDDIVNNGMRYNVGTGYLN